MALSVVALVLVMGCATDQSKEIAQLRQEVSDLKVLAGPPPTSLDTLYPPEADAPVYQIKMFEMEAPFTGIAIETGKGNFELAKAYFERFRTQYLEVSKMVPEWEKEYPLEPVEQLGASLETGEQDKIMAAFGAVAGACNDCHFLNMPKVQQKYHWEDCSGIMVSDPVTKENVKYSQFMVNLNVSFVGIGLELEQGQPDNALKHFEALNSRYQTLKETCGACHQTEREYYVDDNVQALINTLGATLRTSSPDTNSVRTLSQQIGMESCMKCHWLHIPATYAKAQWNERKQGGEE